MKLLKALRLLFYPLSLIYGGIMSLRNRMFDLGLLKQKKYPFTVISVGNLSLGGTGKTPMVIYLLERMDLTRTAVVSRGYGRETKGLIPAHAHEDARRIGDEPKEILMRFPNLKFFVAEKRVEAMDFIQKFHPEIEYVLMDDAFQHRYVDRDFNIMLSAYENPFFKDYVVPVGRLREFRSGAGRSDFILISKCPKQFDANQIERGINPYSKASIGFTKIVYAEEIHNPEMSLRMSQIKAFNLITGIANPRPLLNHLNTYQGLKKHFKFKDHHNFSQEDLNNFEMICSEFPETVWICTAKDYARLSSLKLSENFRKSLYYIPISVAWEFGESEFLKRLQSFSIG